MRPLPQDYTIGAIYPNPSLLTIPSSSSGSQSTSRNRDDSCDSDTPPPQSPPPFKIDVSTGGSKVPNLVMVGSSLNSDILLNHYNKISKGKPIKVGEL